MQSVAQIFDLALQHHQAGNFGQAELLYRQILQVEPRHVDALHLSGLIAHQVGRNDLAVAYIQQALRLHPEFAEAYNNLGRALMLLGKRDEAIASFQQVLRRQPNHAEAHYNLGLVLQEQGRLDEAIASYQQAVRRKPDYAEAYSNMGAAHHVQGRLDEAIASYRQALRCKPDFAAAHNNLGIVQRDHGHLHEAITSYRQALRLKPDYVDAHVNLALVLLLQGNFEEGWREFDWRRYSLTESYSRPSSSLAFWDGSPLQGRTILLLPEQGLGDTLQFVRYAPLLKEKGAGKVVVGCTRELVRLLSHCAGVDEVVNEVTLSAYEVHTLLFCLPRLLGTSAVERIPANVPYLDCDPELVARWRARLDVLDERRSSLRVGIVWQGNPGHKGDRWRSVRLEQFAALAELAGVRLVSLQKGAGSEQLAKMPGLAVDLGPELTDMADTAAVMRCLDLVITVDTAVAHLAGGLGIPVWVVLSTVPDWRWLLERADSPWYPSMRLFRQAEPGQWDDVFRRIKIAIELYTVPVV